MYKSKKLCILLLILFSVLTAPLRAQPAQLSQKAQVSLITASPGDELYSIFGHTALRIIDPANNIDRTYNYGTFDFDTDGFYRKFALGNLKYFLSVNEYERAKQAYLKAGRTIAEQRLNLSPEQTRQLFRYLQTNVRPENRYYSYEFFYDNCTTRAYDAINVVAGDSIRFQKPLNPEKKSFRQFINRYLEPVPWSKFGINVLLGTPADRIPNGMQTLFLPDLLKERFANARIQRSDTSLALVAGQNIYAPSNPATFTTPFITPAMAFWLLLGFVVPLSFIFHSRKTFWHWFDRFLFGVIGLIGVLILFLWLFSSYPSTKWNWNILWTLVVPLLLYGFLNIDKTSLEWSTTFWLIASSAITILVVTLIYVESVFSILPILLLMIYRGYMRLNFDYKERNSLSEQTISAYNRQAANYEAKWKSYLNHTHEAFLRRIKTTTGDTILDVSGGTGLLAKMLVDGNYAFRHLVVNDPSEKMLAIARDRLSDKERISFSNDRAEEISVKSNQFDRIFCLNSFHFYTNQPEVLDRLNIMLKPGGCLYILDWNRSGFFAIVNKILTWVSSEHIDTRSLPEMNQMVNESGFRLNNQESWSWRYWTFFFVEAHKPG